MSFNLVTVTYFCSFLNGDQWWRQLRIHALNSLLINRYINAFVAGKMQNPKRDALLIRYVSVKLNCCKLPVVSIIVTSAWGKKQIVVFPRMQRTALANSLLAFLRAIALEFLGLSFCALFAAFVCLLILLYALQYNTDAMLITNKVKTLMPVYTLLKNPNTIQMIWTTAMIKQIDMLHAMASLALLLVTREPYLAEYMRCI